MQRDMELIRKILIAAEEQPVPREGQPPPSRFLQIDGYDEVTVARHIELLEEAGLVVANLLRAEGYGALKGRVERLTWFGYEFLDAARNDTVWNKTKAIVKEKGGSIPFSLLQDLLLAGGKMIFGLS